MTSNLLSAIGFLSYERPVLLQKGLDALSRQNPDFFNSSLRFIYDNGSSPENLVEIEKIARNFGCELLQLGIYLPPTQDFTERETRSSKGHLMLMKILLSSNADTFLIHEDDWECIDALPIVELATYLKTQGSRIGQIRLRKCEYDGSLTGYQKYNFVTGEDLQWGIPIQLASSKLNTANLHWTNNPSLTHRAALEVLAEGFSTELDCMKRFYESYKLNAQLIPGVFIHTGPWRVRHDLIEKGIVIPGG